MKNLQDLKIFIETARLGSLSACARQMDLSPAVVSAAIKRLEAELDTVLFIRSTRRLRLTNKGEQFLQHCRDAVNILETAALELHNDTHEISGNISLSASSDLGRNLILPLIDDFMAIHPKVTVQLHLSDSYADLYGQQIEMSLRYGIPKDSTMIAVPIVTDNYPILVASQSYIKRHGKPKTPQQLAEHNCLCLGHDERILSQWVFENGKQKLEVEVSGNRSSKDGDVVRRWAVAGHGIAMKSHLDVAADIKAGRLQQIEFSGWYTPKYPLYLMCPERRLIDPLFNALKEHLIKNLN